MARSIGTITLRAIVTAVPLGVLAVGLLVHRFHRDAADGSRSPVQVAAPAATALTRPSRAGGGWIARPEPGRHSAAGASGRRPPVAEAVDAEVHGNRTSAAASATPLRLANPRRNAGEASHSVPPGETAAGIRAEWAVPLRDVAAVFGSRRPRDTEGAGGAQAESGQPEEAAPLLNEASPTGASPIYDSGEAARFSTDERVQVPDSGGFSGETGTISFQFEPEWSDDYQADAVLVEIGESHLVIRKHQLILRFEMNDDDGNGLVAPVSMAQWEPDRPYLVTATWRAGVMRLYVDGRLVAHQPFGPRVEIPAGTPVYVGTVWQDAPVAPGSLSNIQLFTEALSPLQVAARAAQVSRKAD
jgi:hypothetical protein